MNGAEGIVDVLIDAGITHFFGIPGGAVIDILNAMYDRQDRIKPIVARDEQAASCMAEMYGKLTGKPGVFAAQGGFAASTGLFAVLDALLASTPMLVLTEFSDYGPFSIHSPMQAGTGEYGSFDMEAIFKNNTKYLKTASSPREAVLGVQLAIKHAISGRPGPSACIFKANAVRGMIEKEGLPTIHETASFLTPLNTCPPQNEINKAAELLVKAARPVIISGNGLMISRGFEELREIAELLGAPVVTSYLGKSGIPETHPLAGGPIGYTGRPLANEILSLADVILVIGCRLKPQETCFENPKLIDTKRQKIIQIDIDPRNVSWTIPAHVALIGNAALSLRLLIDAVRRQKINYNSSKRIEEFKALKEKRALLDQPVLQSTSIPIYPQRVVRELQEVLPADAIISTDGGNNRHWMNHYFQTKTSHSYFGTGGLGGVSWSLPAALAAKIIYPNRVSVGVSGDGGFAMQLHILLTALQYNASPVYVIMNNSAFEMTAEGMGKRRIGVDFPDVDFAAIARSCKCFGERVTKPGEVAEAVRAALGQNKPAVVDVVIDKNQVMKGTIYSPLAKEALSGIKKVLPVDMDSVPEKG